MLTYARFEFLTYTCLVATDANAIRVSRGCGSQQGNLRDYILRGRGGIDEGGCGYEMLFYKDNRKLLEMTALRNVINDVI